MTKRSTNALEVFVMVGPHAHALLQHNPVQHKAGIRRLRVDSMKQRLLIMKIHGDGLNPRIVSIALVINNPLKQFFLANSNPLH